MARGDLADALDHPAIFLLVMSIGVASTLCILAWAFKAAGMPGAAAFVAHP
jgi:hypothetical protein